MGEGKKNVEGQTTHRRRGVKLLGHRYKAHTGAIEPFHEPCKVEQRPAQPVYLINQYAIDAAGLEVVEKPLQGRSFEVRATKTAIIILFRDQCPTSRLLAGDIRFARFPLRL